MASKEEILSILKKVSDETGFKYCSLVAMATIESNLNPNAHRGGSSFYGLFQIAVGYGGIKLTDIYDPEKNTKAAIKKMQENKEKWIKSNRMWNDVYYYIMHQQGYCGAALIFDNKSKKFFEINNKSVIGPGGCSGSTIVKNMRGNPPQAPINGEKQSIDYSNDLIKKWVESWYNRWQSLIQDCNGTKIVPTSIIAEDQGTAGTSGIQDNLVLNQNQGSTDNLDQKASEAETLATFKEISDSVISSKSASESFRNSSKDETEAFKEKNIGKTWEIKKA